jgi:nucleotide-binding universal stress UspA family protein
MEQSLFKKIVVPLDGSSTAEVALPYAEELAARINCDLILLFVKEKNDYRAENIIQCYMNDMTQKSANAIDKFVADAGKKGIKVITKILTGNPADEIINFTDSEPGSYVIMSTHGMSGSNTRWALGSVVEKVVRATSAPIGVIRAVGDKPAVHEPVMLKHILVTLDGSKEGEVVLVYAQELARILQAEMTLLRVNKLEFDISLSPWNRRRHEAMNADFQQYLEDVSADIKAQGIPVKYVVRETQLNVADEINKYTRENSVDVIIMATHGYSGAKRWVLGSVANRVLMEGNTPMILVSTPVK